METEQYTEQYTDTENDFNKQAIELIDLILENGWISNYRILRTNPSIHDLLKSIVKTDNEADLKKIWLRSKFTLAKCSSWKDGVFQISQIIMEVILKW